MPQARIDTDGALIALGVAMAQLIADAELDWSVLKIRP